MTFKAAKCPNCAGDIQVPDDRDTVKCMYCGSDIVVREAIKLASGVNVENLMMLAKTAEDSKNWPEAYKYYSTVLEYEPKNVAAWAGKGISAVFGVIPKNSPLLSHNLAMNCFQNAIAYSTEVQNIKADIKSRIINNINAPDDLDLLDRQVLSVNCGKIALILEVDQDYIPGLIAKGLQETSGPSQPNYENAIKFYQKAIELSKHDNRVLQIIINFIPSGFYPINTTKFSSVLEEKKVLIDFMHKINPNVRPIEEMIFGELYRSYSDGRKAESNIKELYYNLLREIQHVNPSYKTPRPPNSIKLSYCFIATAAYGSPFASEVVLLQNFRDQYLVSCKLGRWFTSLYYLLSPPIANIISKSIFLRSITRRILKLVLYVIKTVL